MSLYGISRLLGNRELGPAQLLPTLQAFSSHAGNNGELLRAMFAELREAAPPSLVEPIGQLEAASVQVTEDIVEMFARRGKLRAKERLDLESHATRLGAELEAVRDLVSTLQAAMHPRSARLTLSELFDGKWRPPTTFPRRSVEVRTPVANALAFETNPPVLWALVEHSLHIVIDAGVHQPVATVRRDGDSVLFSVGGAAGSMSEPTERRVLALGAAPAFVAPTLEAVANVAGLRKDSGDGSLVQIALAGT